MVTELALTLLITEWVPLQMQMWLLYDKYNLFYFLPKPMWFHFSLPQYYLCLKIKLSLAIKDRFANFTKITKKCSVKLSKWIANCILQTVNLNPETKFIIMGISQSDLIQSEKGSEKVELKENYAKWNNDMFNIYE